MGIYEEVFQKMTRRVVHAEAETPHLKELVAGTLPVEKFRFQACQNYNYLVEYAKAWAVGLAKCDDYETMVLWLEFVRETVDHEIAFYRSYWKDRLGLSLEDLEGTVMSAVKRSYTSHELARSWEGDLAEQLTALLPCAFCYWELGKYLKGRCTLPKDHMYREWIEFYTTGWYDEVCGKLIDLVNGLTRDKTPMEKAKLAEIYAVGCNYEYLSWDMYYQMKTWDFEDIFPKKHTLYKNLIS